MPGIFSCLLGAFQRRSASAQAQDTAVEYGSSPTQFVLLLVNASNPFAGAEAAGQAMSSLKSLKKWIFRSCPALAAATAQKMPPLMKCLKGVSGSTMKNWKSKLLSMVAGISLVTGMLRGGEPDRASVYQSDGELVLRWFLGQPHFLEAVMMAASQEWRYALMDEFCACVPRYSQFRYEKGFLLMCMGTSLASCQDKEKVKSQLWNMCSHIRNSCVQDLVNLIYGFHHFWTTHHDISTQAVQDCHQVLWSIKQVAVFVFSWSPAQSLMLNLLTAGGTGPGGLERRAQDPAHFLEEVTSSGSSPDATTSFSTSPSMKKEDQSERLETMKEILRACSRWTPDRSLTPQSWVAWMLVKASSPFVGDEGVDTGTFALERLKNQLCRTSGSVSAHAASEIPRLLRYLKDVRIDTIDTASWEAQLFSFLEGILQTSPDDWTYTLVEKFSKCVRFYSESLHEKAFIYRCLGICLAFSRDREKMRARLWKMCPSDKSSYLEDAANIIYGFQRVGRTYADRYFPAVRYCKELVEAIELDPGEFLTEVYSVSNTLTAISASFASKQEVKLYAVEVILQHCSQENPMQGYKQMNTSQQVKITGKVVGSLPRPPEA